MEKTYFKWDSNFLTGNIEIDEQHFRLVELINELLQVSLNFKDFDLDEIAAIKDKLSDYVVIHFTSEEGLMDKYGVDKTFVDKHKTIHKDFVAKVDDFFSNESEYNDEEKLANISEFLIRWLAYHVLNIDKSLVRQLKNIIEKKMSSEEAYLLETQLDESTTEPLLKALRVLYGLVSKKNKEIEKKNDELEERVAKRTRELQEANRKLEEMSVSDELTGLPNRRFVMKEIDKHLYEWGRYRTPFSLLFIDVDKFKEINDQYGHSKGDRVLIWLGDYIQKIIRMNDIVCRIGGDEFVVLCTHTDLEDAISVGEKLNRISSMEAEEGMEYWKPSISIGIASVEGSLVTASELLKKADKAMYDAKSQGGGQYKVRK